MTSSAVPRRPRTQAPIVVQELVHETKKGREFVAALTSGRYRYLAMGGAIGGVKSFTTLSALICLARIFPGSRWAIVRKDLPTLRRTVIPTIEKMRPPRFMGELNHSTWSYSCANGSEIILFPESIQEDPDLNRWKSFEVNGFLLEEANELAEKSFHKAIERAGRWIIPATAERPAPKQPPLYVLLTFNPTDNWVKRVFYEPFRAGTLAAPYFFLPTTIADNPFLTPEYLESLKNLPEREYKRFVLGDWETTTDPDQLIDSTWIINAANVPFVPGPTTLGVDVARYGDDFSTLVPHRGNELLVSEIERRHGESTTETAGRVAKVITEKPVAAGNVRVDVVGLGAGTVDTLHDRHFKVREIVSGGSPIPRAHDDPNHSVFRFKNLRSQMWWEYREKLRTGRERIARPTKDDPNYRRLFEDLTAPKYMITGDKVIEVESKDDIKKRLGRSTDDGDGAVMAAFDLPVGARSLSAPSSSYVSV